jgi:hypothetical protein
MKLIDQMRRDLAEARDSGRSPDHWEIMPDALQQLKAEASPGELTGTEYAGLWALDGLGLRESLVPGESRYLLISRRP